MYLIVSSSFSIFACDVVKDDSVGALFNPFFTETGETAVYVDFDVRVGIRAACIIDSYRRVGGFHTFAVFDCYGGVLVDLSHRHSDGMHFPIDVDFMGIGI